MSRLPLPTASLIAAANVNAALSLSDNLSQLDKSNSSLKNPSPVKEDNPSSSEDCIFYPLELSKAPEYQAYTLIQLFQPETTDLDGATTEERLSAAKAALGSELGKFGGILGAGAITRAFGGGGLLALTSAVGVGVAQFMTSVSNDKSNLSPEERETLVAALRREINEQRLSTTRLQIQAKPSFGKVKYNIGLPMPKSIKTNYGFEYEDVDFRNVSVLKDISELIRNKTMSVEDKTAAIRGVADMARTARLGALDDVLKLIPGGAANFQQYEDTRAGRVKTPMSESIFKNVSKRTFDFSWEMIPKSRKELESIYKIILLLKTNAHPKQINSDPYYLGIPGEFLVKFYIANKENEFLPKIARLCMKGIDVDYGDDSGMSFFRIENIPPGGNFPDGRLGAPPTKITLSIKMEELEYLTADRIVEGY